MIKILSRVIFGVLNILAISQGGAMEREELDLDVIGYEEFVREDERAITLLKKALYEKGIVGIKGIPGYKEQVLKLIESSQTFMHLPEENKERYAPDHSKGEMFLGYERGKEKFQRPDGKWVIDDLKLSYYGLIPDQGEGRWPHEVDLKSTFQELGGLMSQMGIAVMQKIGLIGENPDSVPQIGRVVGRVLYYCKDMETIGENPYWCGAHFDHGLFTALLPAFYFVDGKPVAEPKGAGLFVKTTADGVFKKVVADDPDILLFQVGEFGQLITDDEIRATEHCVQKAPGTIDRYTMAVFFEPLMNLVIHSHSELTADARYGGAAGEPCSYQEWHEASFNRYIVKEEAEVR